jgi:eukaryotic-like serine/threonine-protein kinase
VTRFFNEARAMTSIPDPGIVQMYDFGFHGDGSAYIVMELLEGETLERRLQRLHRLPLLDALRITRQLAGSLDAAHAAGVIHRDLKPENVFMVRDPEALGGERPKVLDFGVAKLSGDVEHGQTLAGSLVGTPAYMSPEQCRGAGAVDARCDIYALGCVVTRLVTGRLPFDGSGIGELISAHLNDAPARPSAVLPGLPPELDDLVLRCLAKAPADRFQTMLELQSACDALLARLSLDGAPAPGTLAAARSGAGSLPERDAPSFRAASHPTTLSSAAGVTHPSAPGRTRRRGAWIGLGAASIAAGIAAAIALAGGDVPAPDRGSAAVAAPAPPPAPPPPAVAARSAAPAPAAALDAGVAPGGETDQAPRDAALPAAAAPAAPASKSKPRSRPHRPAPERPEDLYDDR